jgi:3-oxoadipate enol-lactonase
VSDATATDTIVEGVRLAYHLDGPRTAPYLVLVNSLGMDLQMWDAQLPRFAASFRVLRYDMRGHGRSDAPPGPYTIAQLGRDLVALLDALAIERAQVCGLSLGGLVVQWLAAEHPQRVARVVLANTAARIGSDVTWNERIAAVRAGGLDAIRDLVMARFLSAQFREEHSEETQRIAGIFAATPAEGYIAACVALRDADLHSALQRITAPVLVVTSDLDESTPASQARELQAAIAGSELVQMEGAAHLSNVERPEAFGDCVLAFLRQG